MKVIAEGVETEAQRQFLLRQRLPRVPGLPVRPGAGQPELREAPAAGALAHRRPQRAACAWSAAEPVRAGHRAGMRCRDVRAAFCKVGAATWTAHADARTARRPAPGRAQARRPRPRAGAGAARRAAHRAGRRAGDAARWPSLAPLAHVAAGQVGRLAEDYVEGRIDIDGAMRPVIDVAARLVRDDPTRAAEPPGPLAWWRDLMQRGKSLQAPPRRGRRAAGAVPLRRVGRLLRAVARRAARLLLRLLPPSRT